MANAGDGRIDGRRWRRRQAAKYGRRKACSTPGTDGRKMRAWSVGNWRCRRAGVLRAVRRRLHPVLTRTKFAGMDSRRAGRLHHVVADDVFPSSSGAAVCARAAPRVQWRTMFFLVVGRCWELRRTARRADDVRRLLTTYVRLKRRLASGSENSASSGYGSTMAAARRHLRLLRRQMEVWRQDYVSIIRSLNSPKVYSATCVFANFNLNPNPNFNPTLRQKEM